MAADNTVTVKPRPKADKTRAFQLRINAADEEAFRHAAAEDQYLDANGRGLSTWAVEILREVVRRRRVAGANHDPNTRAAPKKRKR